MVDRTVLQYQIGEKLGAGGMGEIYKARDTRLNRFVAMKVLPAGMSADPERRRRFLHEAQAASALNHPNIITIYDIVTDGGTQFMVVEYVAGKTLLELIPQDGLRVPQAIQYATQIADALTAAHTAGIIHRDLKPANVMVTTGGLVKVLDFGLAKLIEYAPGEHTGNTATMESPLTIDGAIMGTVNYMSPEQAEGKRLDPRSDIFSFGAVLYEMLTGRHAFKGDSPISTLSAVLRDDVQPILALSPDVPAELERIVVKCLQKDPAERFQSMREVFIALAALKRQSESGELYNPPTMRTVPPTYVSAGAPAAVSQPPASKSSSKALAVAAVCVLIAAAAGAYWWTNQHRPAFPAAVVQTSAPAAAPSAPAALTNDNIIAMVKANVAPSLIASQIRSSKTSFNLSPAEVIRLSQAGVSPDLIEIMRNPQAPATPPPAPVVVADGLPVPLTLAADIPTDAEPGDPIRFKVADPVQVDGSVVIPEGASATGAIVDGAKHKILGLGGKMTYRLDTVDAADGHKISLRATPAPHPESFSKHPVNTAGKKPKDIASLAGTEYVGYIDGAKTVLVKK